MSADGMFDQDSEDTEEALMAATYRALCEHGYADLTIEKIGEEFQKSTSLLYHHHAGKDALLVEFLASMLESFESDIPFADLDDDWARLVRLLDHVLAPCGDADREQFTSAMIELRAQAAHDSDYRAAFTKHDEFFHARLASVIEEGVDAGTFREVDPQEVAALIQTTFNGAMLQLVTTGDGVDIEDVRTELEAMLSARLLPEERDE
jgi:AcrR family transcriptional regulator